MGAAASVVNWKPKEIMTVDPPGPGWRAVKTFSRAIFKKYEWETLKVFCQKYKIAQRDLVRVFRDYLSGDEAYVRDFQVQSMDCRNQFGKYSKLFQELADVFIPAMYLRNFTGLQPVESGEFVSFARFIINSYIFGCQHFPDLIYDFFAVLRQKLDIQVSVVISPFSVSKIIDLLTEEFEDSGTLRTLKMGLKRLEEGPDMRLFSIIHMGVKYPLMFYVVERFRKLYKRVVFGDKFWKGRKFIKLRHIDVDDYVDDDLDVCFTTVEVATRRTALSIIADSLAMAGQDKAWFPNDTFRLSPAILSSEQVTTLKAFLGYKAARAVLLESAIPLDFNAPFLQSHFVHAPVQSPPSKTLPVSPWTDSEGDLSPDAYGSAPPSADQLAATSPRSDAQLQHQPQRGHGDAPEPTQIPLVGYDVDDTAYRRSRAHSSAVASPRPNDADEYLRSQLFPADLSPPSSPPEGAASSPQEGDRDGVLMIHDAQFDRDFRYDVHTGRSRWLQLFRDADGRVVREVFY